MSHLKPMEILEATIAAAEVKAKGSLAKLMVLGILAGMFIALGGMGANMCGYGFFLKPETTGIGKMITGLIFPAGLSMVLLCGAELFTGNCMMFAAVLEKRITAAAMLRNWVIVYFSNLIGAVLIAWMCAECGLLHTGADLLQQVTINIAVAKESLSFGDAFLRGVLCNFLVCIAVWAATGARDTVGKVLALFLPIWLFVTCGFEHSIANMFFIPIGIFADAGAEAGLSWLDFFVTNLIPVTLGNIVGGSIFTGAAYWYALKKA